MIQTLQQLSTMILYELESKIVVSHPAEVRVTQLCCVAHRGGTAEGLEFCLVSSDIGQPAG